MAKFERKLVAILATDAAGYSRMMQVDEEGTLQMLNAHRETIDRLIADFDGRIIGTGGDSVIAEFGSASDAVVCAVEFQREIEIKNHVHSQRIPKDRLMYFRVGINVGDVMIQADDILGSGVNIAARLETLAEVGGVFISGTTYDQVASILDLDFEELGLRKVKNISEPIRVYRVRGLGADNAEHTGVSAMTEAGGTKDNTISLKPEIASRHENSAKDAVQSGDSYGAIREYCLALDSLGSAGDIQVRSRLRDARQHIERRLSFHGDIVAETSLGRVYVRIGESTHIGRSKQPQGAKVNIGYKKLSRFGKQCRITYRKNQFFVTDLGSVNGTFLDDQLLPSKERVPLNLTQGPVVLSIGGTLEPPSKGSCRLVLQLIGGTTPALVMKLDTESLSLDAENNLRQNWPSLDEDLRSTWIFATGAVLIGIDVECAIKLPQTDEPYSRARLDYGPSGYTIGADFGDTVTLDNVEFDHRVVLAEGSEVRLGQQRLAFHRAAR